MAVCKCPMPLKMDGAICVHKPIRHHCLALKLLLPRPLLNHVTSLVTSSVLSSDSSKINCPPVQVYPCVKLLKKLPRSSREQAAWKMAGILEEVILKNDITTWTRFLNFLKRSFRVPNRGGKRWKFGKTCQYSVSREE